MTKTKKAKAVEIDTSTEDVEKILTSLYQTGDPKQQRLFEPETDHKRDLYKDSQKFYKFISVESRKRKTDPLALIKYFSEHKKEFTKLWKKKGIKSPEFKKIYVDSETENIMRTVLKTQRLENKGIQTVDIPTIGEESIRGEMQVWESQGIQYFAKTENILKFDGQNPKVFVSQLKNISLLIGMVQEQQFNNDFKKAQCRFNLSHYVARRGHTKEEIQKGGKFFDELKRDLYTGAYTTYRIDKIMIEGNEYIAHGIPNFYTLYEPKKSEIDWIVTFNNPYAAWLLQTLDGKANRFFVTNRKAIEDRVTTNKPYLFLFYMQLAKRKRKELTTMPIMIGSLLNDMKLGEQILARPKECFKILWDCLNYFREHYQPDPEIENVGIYNDFHRTKTIKIPIEMRGYFGKCTYEDFKPVLAEIGIKDIRKAYISFKRPAETPSRGYKLTDEEKYIREITLNWFKGKVTKIPAEDQKSQITMYIKKLGYERYSALFRRESNKDNANAIEFLTRVLPSYDMNVDSLEKKPSGIYRPAAKVLKERGW